MRFLRKPPSPLAATVPSRDHAWARDADIAAAYRLVLHREPDAAGLAHYRERIRSGLTVEQLVASLVDSDERRHPAPVPPPSAAQVEGRFSASAIDPRQVMRQHTVEELNATAEEYYRRVDDPAPLMSKPFTFLDETPGMLQNLGLLLAGLHLGKTMTVLDFGAGTGWLSRILAQLNCQPIACDVSPSALEIGRRLMHEQPLIGTAVFQPRFLPFDGHRLDLPDATVDRIVCFDAFHHVPNAHEVIAEFARVLKPGGIAGFSEPGPRHSRSAQSQYEMRTHRVLENDIDLNEISLFASSAGFTGIEVRVLNDVVVDLDGYNRICRDRRDDELRDDIWRSTCDTMSDRTIFFLRKGAPAFDSRSHIGLAHEIHASAGRVDANPDRTVTLTFTLVNTGTATWLHTNTEIFGVVRLGAHLLDQRGHLLAVDHSRHDLPETVRPGQAVALTVQVSLPGPGVFTLAFDLVSEGVSWFENLGSRPINIEVHVPEDIHG